MIEQRKTKCEQELAAACRGEAIQGAFDLLRWCLKKDPQFKTELGRNYKELLYRVLPDVYELGVRRKIFPPWEGGTN